MAAGSVERSFCVQPRCPSRSIVGSRFCERHTEQLRQQRNAQALEGSLGAARAERERMSRRDYPTDWKTVSATYRKANDYCVACYATINLTVDHIVPLRQGGDSSWSNLRTLCRRCHGIVSANTRWKG